MKPYPTYKPSGIEWLGDVPAHWDVRRIKTLFREVNLRKGDKEYVLLSLTRRHGLVPHDEVTDKLASAVDHTNYKVCHEGNLVMNRMQAWSGMFAVPSLVGIVSPDYAIYEPTVACELSYFEQLFKTRLMVNQFAQHSKGIGSGFNRLYTEVFGSIPTLAPPLQEQRAIARYLDYMDSRIQRYIEAKERLIELLEEQRRAVINQAVTRGLDPDVRLKPSGVEWLGDVPAHWGCRQLRTVTRVVNGATPSTNTPRYWDGDIVWVTPDDLGRLSGRYVLDSARRITSEGYESCGTRLVSAGSIAISTRAPIGHVGILKIDACVNQGCRLLVPNSQIDTEFLFLVLIAAREELGSLGQGSTFTELSRTKLAGFKLPVPPYEEQARIVNHVDGMTSNIDAQILKCRRQIELINEYRTRLIADVVTGKLDVREAAADLPNEMDEDELSNRLELAEVG